VGQLAAPQAAAQGKGKVPIAVDFVSFCTSIDPRFRKRLRPCGHRRQNDGGENQAKTFHISPL
jgi:hypothetical protein